MTLRVTRWYWWGSRVSMAVDEAAEQGIEAAAEIMLADANRHVPFDEGVLMSTGEVDTEKNRVGLAAASVEGAVSYNTPYAVRLHEHPEYNFQGQGEGKWLEHALKRAEVPWVLTLARRLIQVFKLP